MYSKSLCKKIFVACVAFRSNWFFTKPGQLKKICCLFVMLLAGMSLFAQINDPKNKLQEKKEIEGFMIQLKQAPHNTYLFEITQNGLPLGIRPRNNPVTMTPDGFNSKEDAYKMAEWMIGQYKKTGHIPPFVPHHIAKELNISVENLNHKQ